jgi:soluble lytic murein transglycosylase-like protein
MTVTGAWIMATDYKAVIVNKANQYGVPPAIALAVAQQESSTRQYDSSGKVIARYEPHLNQSSLGIFQLLESTARDLGVNPNDPMQNIDGGVRYLKQLYGMTGNWESALQAYNGGIGNWQRGTTSAAAKSYAVQVLNRASMTNVGTTPGQVGREPSTPSEGD